MGYGDNLMAIGDAYSIWMRQPVETKRKVAVGNGSWLTDLGDLTYGLDEFLISNQQEGLLPGTPWVISKPGMRPYIDYAAMRTALRRQGIIIEKQSKLSSRLGRYIWNLGYKATPAPFVLTDAEQELVDRAQASGPFIAVEPFLKDGAPTSKQYPVARMREVALRLAKDVQVFQISHSSAPELDPSIPRIKTTGFRQTVAYLKAAGLYIGPEGGLHHGSAAVGTRAVVLFGGYIPPSVTGYDFHVNLTGGATQFTGIKHGCNHCIKAMNNITVDEILRHARTQLELEYAL